LLLHFGAGLLHTTNPQVTPSFDQSGLFPDGTPFPAKYFPYLSGLNSAAFLLPGFTGGGSLSFNTASFFEAPFQEDVKPTFNANATWIKANHTFKLGATAMFEGIPSILAGRANGEFEFSNIETADPAPPTMAPLRTLAAAADFLLTWLGDAGLLADLSASVHRIVHGGERFRATTRLGDAELTALAALDELAPLHNPPALAVIASVRARLPASVPLIGVFDTAYYATLPEVAWRYAIPESWYRDFGVRRYGFHGIAHRYLCSSARARVAAGQPSSRIVSLQLGRGCSVTATLGEQPVATSMGFTPVEGLVMAGLESKVRFSDGWRR